MSIIKAVQGESLTIECWFRSTDNTIIPPISGQPAQYSVRDFDFNLITSGVGMQDISDPSRWYANITIPINAPISVNGMDKYRLDWSLPSIDGTHTITEMFSVLPYGDPIRQYNDVDVLMLENGPFNDSLYVETNGLSPVSSVTLSIVDEMNTQALAETPVSSSGNVGTALVYSFNAQAQSIPNLVCNQVLNTFLSIWTTVRTNGNVDFEVHPIYVVNPCMLRYMNSIKQLVDRARLGDIHPYLQFKPVDLIHHLFRGIEYVAAAPPNASTRINPAMLPGALADFIIKAGAVSLLRAQLLAEGMSNFEFQGLGVQLSVDRTQVIDNLIQQLVNDLNEPLRLAKSNWIRAGQPSGPIGSSVGKSPYINTMGRLNLSVGPYTNFMTNGWVMNGWQSGQSLWGNMSLLRLSVRSPYGMGVN